MEIDTVINFLNFNILKNDNVCIVRYMINVLYMDYIEFYSLNSVSACFCF